MSQALQIFLWRAGNAILAIGVLQLLACWSLAIAWYPGGYSSNTMFLSHLGSSVGGLTTISGTLFNTSLVVLAIALVPFYIFFPVHAPDRYPWLWAAAGFGLFSSCGLFLVGFSPLDTATGYHNLGLAMWLFGILIAVSIHAVATYTSDYCHSFFSLVGLLLVFVIGVYLFQMLKTGLVDFRITDVVRPLFFYQKMAVGSALCWFVIMSVRIVVMSDFSPHFEKRQRSLRTRVFGKTETGIKTVSLSRAMSWLHSTDWQRFPD